MRISALLCALLLFGLFSCAPSGEGVSTLKSFPLDSLEGVITRSGVELDKQVSSDGRGSLRVTAKGPVTVRLFEVPAPNVEDARLSYRARLKAENLDGRAYLEMWCRFPGQGEYFSKALNDPLTGTTDWVSQETSFALQEGQNPDLVKLNLVIEGRGTVWVDDVKLLEGPLK